MKFGIQPALRTAEWPKLLDHWLVADTAFYEYGAPSDHFYDVRYSEDGGFVGNDAGTTRLRLCVMVSAMPYRHPAVLANMVATIDHISKGRLEVGLGAGWSEPEADAYGLPLGTVAERMDRLEEGIGVIRGLLSEDRFSFAGRYYTVVDAVCEPKALQRPHPPLVIGGGGERRTIPHAARWAQHWNFPTGDVKLWSQRRDRLR